MKPHTERMRSSYVVSRILISLALIALPSFVFADDLIPSESDLENALSDVIQTCVKIEQTITGESDSIHHWKNHTNAFVSPNKVNQLIAIADTLHIDANNEIKALAKVLGKKQSDITACADLERNGTKLLDLFEYQEAQAQVQSVSINATKTALDKVQEQVDDIKQALAADKPLVNTKLFNGELKEYLASPESKKTELATLIVGDMDCNSPCNISYKNSRYYQVLKGISELNRFGFTYEGRSLYALRHSEQWQLYGQLEKLTKIDTHIIAVLRAYNYTKDSKTETIPENTQTEWTSIFGARLYDAKYQLYSMLADFEPALSLLAEESPLFIARIRAESHNINSAKLEALLKERHIREQQKERDDIERMNLLMARKLSFGLSANEQTELSSLLNSLDKKQNPSIDIPLDGFGDYYDPMRRFYIGSSYTASDKIRGDVTAVAGFVQYYQPYGEQLHHRELDIGIGSVKTTDTEGEDETRYSLTIKRQWTWMPLNRAEDPPGKPYGFMETSEGKIFYGPTFGLAMNAFEQETVVTDSTANDDTMSTEETLAYRLDWYAGYRWAISPESYIDLLGARCHIRPEVVVDDKPGKHGCRNRVRADLKMSFDAFTNGDKFKVGILLDMATENRDTSLYPNTIMFSFAYHLTFGDLYSSVAK